MASGIKKTLMKQAMKLMQSETAMKLMQNPRVMNTVMQAFALRGQIQGAMESASETLAKTLGFATKEEIQKLRATIRELEEELAEVKGSPAVDRPVD